ncbi:MAG: isochorismatase family protein [Gammaproteobacteria bacterium]
MVQQSNIIPLSTGDVLIIIDLQNDFLPGGALAVKQGEQIIPIMNRYIEIFQRHRLPIFATRDWHPRDHCSFKKQGGPWPEHCVAGTVGAAFSNDLALPQTAVIISKGSNPNAPGYSGFENTDLEKRLSRLQAKRLFIGGLATEYCVFNTVMDALALRYRVHLLQDAIRAVDIAPHNGHNAIEHMKQKGALTLTLSDLQ